MKTLKQKKQRKDFKKKQHINNSISEKTRENNKGPVQPYLASHKLTKAKK